MQCRRHWELMFTCGDNCTIMVKFGSRKCKDWSLKGKITILAQFNSFYLHFQVILPTEVILLALSVIRMITYLYQFWTAYISCTFSCQQSATVFVFNYMDSNICLNKLTTGLVTFLALLPHIYVTRIWSSLCLQLYQHLMRPEYHQATW